MNLFMIGFLFAALVVAGCSVAVAFVHTTADRRLERSCRTHARHGTALAQDMMVLLNLPRYADMFNADDRSLLRLSSYTGISRGGALASPDSPAHLDPNMLIGWLVACRRGTQDPAFLMSCIRAGLSTHELAGHLDGTAPLDRGSVEMLAGLRPDP